MPRQVADQLATWANELEHAEALTAAGERCLPLLLVGETRCGKTSAALQFAQDTDRHVLRLNASQVIESYMGESAKRLKVALDEVAWLGGCVFVIDEVDAIAMPRSGTGSHDKERNHLVGCMLTWLEELPPHVPLICTSNCLDAIDSAVAARMTVIEWPTWAELSWDDGRAFFAAHGAPGDAVASSYAEAVAIGRAARVGAIIGGPQPEGSRQQGLFSAQVAT